MVRHGDEGEEVSSVKSERVWRRESCVCETTCAGNVPVLCGRTNLVCVCVMDDMVRTYLTHTRWDSISGAKNAENEL